MTSSAVLWLLLALLLPISALAARGLPADRVMRLIVIWTMIISGVAVAVWLMQQNGYL